MAEAAHVMLRSPAQWAIQERIAFGEVSQWRTRAREIAQKLADQMNAKQLAPGFAPDMPTIRGGWDGFIEQPYRFLTTWIPDWSQVSMRGTTW